MTRKFRVLLEWDSDSEVWVTYVPALNFLSTFGDTRDEALEHTREAILLYLDGAEDDDQTVVETLPPAELLEVEVPAT